MGLGAFYFHLPFQLGNKNFGIFRIAGVTAVMNLGLNFWLIPKMGMHGAAISTLLSFMFSSALGFIYGRRVFPIPFPTREVIKILIATLFMGVCLWFLRDLRGWHWLVVQMAVGLGSYGLASYLLNVGGLKQVVAARYA
jgi:peptidoglycan biosynthesis protein MviN/MurJ (putative lipid II flippase)